MNYYMNYDRKMVYLCYLGVIILQQKGSKGHAKVSNGK